VIIVQLFGQYIVGIEKNYRPSEQDKHLQGLKIQSRPPVSYQMGEKKIVSSSSDQSVCGIEYWCREDDGNLQLSVSLVE
jgi:hypothetical protein